ncbi:MAG: cellulase family glycosylhydrolase [Coriobacteriales bacterium]|nr:cellulase family glycosylhydrolase [Coriobacteriales bacterium]
MAERALHGVNLTGWLTLEPWVTPELFADSGALDEASLITALGRNRYRALVKKHRKEFIEAADFTRIASRGFNAVRLAVPWYAYGSKGPECGPYAGCIDYVDLAFDWAEEVGLKLVLMLDASPGTEKASHVAIDGSLDFREYKDALVEVVSRLSRRYGMRDGFYGLEVLSSPAVQRHQWLQVTEGVQQHTLRNYYRDAYQAIRRNAGDDAVVILPDAGIPGGWRHFMAQSRYQNVWLDCSFTRSDMSKRSVPGPAAVRRLADDARKRLLQARKSGLPAMVGSWSGALPYADSLMTPEGRIALERVFISEQIAAFKGCSAWFFETWKTSGRLSGWDARVSLATFERRMLD